MPRGAVLGVSQSGSQFWIEGRSVLSEAVLLLEDVVGLIVGDAGDEP